MIIHLIANDGSPLTVTPDRIWGQGVGGAELAMMSLMETFAARGHEVTVYNDPSSPGVYDGVTYDNRAAFVTENARDVLIIFRSPNALVNFRRLSKTQRIIWWSTDQYTIGSFAELAGLVQFCVTISPFHTNYHKARYGVPAEKIGHIDLQVRLQDYDEVEVERVRKQLIFCSIPDRGLPILKKVWQRVLPEVPEAALTITSDYTLWGSPTPNNQQHRLAWAMENKISFLGKVPRKELVRHQLASEILSYPCIYEELFCISAAECQVAGAYPVTSGYGALETTNQFGDVVTGTPSNPQYAELFANHLIGLLTDEYEYLQKRRENMMIAARRRFNPTLIAETWEHLFDKGTLPK